VAVVGNCGNQTFPEMSRVSSIAKAFAENKLKILNVQILENSVTPC
jgi:hypothetical protein